MRSRNTKYCKNIIQRAECKNQDKSEKISSSQLFAECTGTFCNKKKDGQKNDK